MNRTFIATRTGLDRAFIAKQTGLSSQLDAISVATQRGRSSQHRQDFHRNTNGLSSQQEGHFFSSQHKQDFHRNIRFSSQHAQNVATETGFSYSITKRNFITTGRELSAQQGHRINMSFVIAKPAPFPSQHKCDFHRNINRIFKIYKTEDQTAPKKKLKKN